MNRRGCELEELDGLENQEGVDPSGECLIQVAIVVHWVMECPNPNCRRGSCPEEAPTADWTAEQLEEWFKGTVLQCPWCERHYPRAEWPCGFHSDYTTAAIVN